MCYGLKYISLKDIMIHDIYQKAIESLNTRSKE